jgi:beta-galactosidase
VTDAIDSGRRGIFFAGAFRVEEPADAYLDMSGYQKGIACVNGRHLGRFWSVGPQQRLYCPAPWLRRGENTIVVFDLHQIQSVPVSGRETLE